MIQSETNQIYTERNIKKLHKIKFLDETEKHQRTRQRCSDNKQEEKTITETPRQRHPVGTTGGDGHETNTVHTL